MMSPSNATRPRHLTLVCVLLIFGTGLVAVTAQRPQDETTRQLWDTAFIDRGKKTNPNKRPARRNYRVATPAVPVEGVAPDSVVGVTLWRLRPTRSADSGERIITHDGPDSISWVPERISSTGRLSEGDRIRISIEAARTGFLYVVDQEQYADGSKGEPYLIFPTTRTRGGDNSVKVGRVIELPAQDDSPPYFTLKRSRVDQAGEIVSVLVTPSPIEGLTITDKAQRLTNETLAQWDKSWGAQTGRLEMTDGEGKPWTKQEKAAGADATRALTENEPAPQTIYYRPGANTTEPVLVKVELQYARRRTTQPRSGDKR